MKNSLFYPFLYLLFCTLSNANVISTTDKKEIIPILSMGKYYIDKSAKMSIYEFKDMDDKKLKSIDKDIKSMGFSSSKLFMKFTIKNSTNIEIAKYLELSPILIENIEFLYKGEVIRRSLKEAPDKFFRNGVFTISMKPNEVVDIYIAISSKNVPLKIKPFIYDFKSLIDNELNEQTVYALFFGAIIVLFIYNIFLLFFIRDTNYVYYFLYVICITYYTVLDSGILFKYAPNLISFSDKTYIYSISLVNAMLMLFMKKFLDIKNRYKFINLSINIYLLVLILLSVISSVYNNLLNITHMYVGAGVTYILFLILYIYFIRKNIRVRFIFLGWIFILSSLILKFLMNSGISTIIYHTPFILEVSILADTILFSTTLGDKFKKLKQDKENIYEQLIEQKDKESLKLKQEVEFRTKELKETLTARDLLIKELHHRVKNNLQTVVSLLRLQIRNIDGENSEYIKDQFFTAFNRIKAMSKVHELLYKDNNIVKLDAKEYFSSLIDGLKNSFDNIKNITIEFAVDTNMDTKNCIYYGLIVNELVSNSFKYAFKDRSSGKIKILFRQDNFGTILSVEDDGVGFVYDENGTSLGYKIVSMLVAQLKAKMEINSSDLGTIISIRV